MSAFSSKTPVSILQEYGVANNNIPSYELIFQNTGTHVSSFRYRVTLGEFFADGDGSSKKIAKHNAAQMLIDILQSRNSVDREELETAARVLSHPQDNIINFNAVGELCTFCSEKQFPEPIYLLVQDEGPPHAKSFTMRCAVSNIFEHGTARTKKQAKHTAAHNMLNKLRCLTGEDLKAVVVHDPSAVFNSPVKTQRPNTDKEAEERFLALTKMKRVPSSSAYVADQHRSILNLIGKSTTLYNIVLTEVKFDDIEEKVTVLETIASELGISLTAINVNSEPPVWCTKFAVKPTVVCSASNKDDSMEKVLRNFLWYFS